MKSILYLTFALLWQEIYGKIGVDDIPGTYTLEPGRGGMLFCTDKLRVETSGSEITRMKFDKNSRVCSTKSLSFYRSSSNLDLLVHNGFVLCGGIRVDIELRQPSEQDFLHEKSSFRYLQDALYLTICDDLDTKWCIYKGDPKISPTPSPIPPLEAQESSPKPYTNHMSIWAWLAPIIGISISLIMTVIVAVIVKTSCVERLTWVNRPVDS